MPDKEEEDEEELALEMQAMGETRSRAARRQAIVRRMASHDSSRNDGGLGVGGRDAQKSASMRNQVLPVSTKNEHGRRNRNRKGRPPPKSPTTAQRQRQAVQAETTPPERKGDGSGVLGSLSLIHI